MVVTARRDGAADEDAVDEECRGDFLEEQQRMAGFARHHVDQGGDREPGQADAAQDHQRAFERIERAPFQMPIGCEDDGDGHGTRRSRQRRRSPSPLPQGAGGSVDVDPT